MLTEVDLRLLMQNLSLSSLRRSFDWYFLFLLDWLGGVIWTNFLMAPVPYVIEEAPNYVFVAVDYFILRPEVPGAKFWKFLEVIQDFLEIGLDL